MVGFWIVLVVVERGLPDGTPGVVEFEFVGSAARAARFRAEWGGGGRATVRALLIVDYGFMVGYGAFVALAGLAVRDFGRRHGRRALAAAGRVAPWLALIAAGFDAFENGLLLVILDGDGGSVAPPVTTACASIKWALIAIAVAYVAWGAGAWLLRARR